SVVLFRGNCRCSRGGNLISLCRRAGRNGVYRDSLGTELSRFRLSGLQFLSELGDNWARPRFQPYHCPAYWWSTGGGADLGECKQTACVGRSKLDGRSLLLCK